MCWIVIQVGPFVRVIPVVVELPLGGLIVDCPVVCSAQGNVSRFFDGDGGLQAFPVRVKKPWDEAHPVQIPDGRQGAQFDQGREDVDETDGLGAPLITVAHPGGNYDEWDPGGFLPEGALVPVSFFPEVPTMVGP